MKSKKLIKNRNVGFIPPMLATLVDKPFSSADWIYETKFDGIRCIAVIPDFWDCVKINLQKEW